MKIRQPKFQRPANPLLKKIFRNAGEYLADQIELIQDNLMQYAMMSCVAFAMAMMTVICYFKPPTFAEMIVIVLFALLFTAYSAWKIVRLLPALRSRQFGRYGEIFVSQLLHKRKERDWRIFDDIQMGGYNLDHVIVAPQGIFCIETKARRDKSNKMLPVRYDGTLLQVGGRYADSPGRPGSILWQVALTRENLQKYLFALLQQRFPLKTVLVFPESSVSNAMGNKPGDVLWVMNPEQLASAVKGLPPVMSPEQRTAVCNVLAKRDQILPV